MLADLVLLPTVTTSTADTSCNTFDDVSGRLRSTLHGLRKTATSMLSSSIDERPVPLSDFEASYARDVLELDYGESEEALDDKLRILAEELGLHAEALRLSTDSVKAPSTNTFGSSNAVRRSESIGSRASRSTGLTNLSDFSRDHRGKTRASLSFRDYDSFLSRGSLSERRDSLTFTPPLTPSQSTLSLALSSPPDASPRKHFRKLRGLNMLKLNRGGSDTSLPLEGCPHCPQNPFSQRRAIHKLPCGHRLCTQALRNTIVAGNQGPLGAVPSCCGIPIPGRLVEQVMTHEEQSSLLDRLEQWDEAASTHIISRHSETHNRQHHHHQASGNASPHDLDTRPKSHDLETILPLPGFPAHRANQQAQRDRFLTWSAHLHASLDTHRTSSRNLLQMRHTSALEDLRDAHAISLAEAEDKQVLAEADLLATHERENRDLATALKHMEAYCAGTLGGGEPHGRTVTDQDRGELEKTRRAREAMASRHEGAIRVLRGEQGRRLKGRMARQEREIASLERAHRYEAAELERSFEMMEGLDLVKREALFRRWEVQDAVFLRKLEVETGVALGGRLPGLDWSADQLAGHESGIPSSSRARVDSRLT
ncbi:hypothetical protein Q7P35_008421 [Cladosporium inversicolor]